MAKLVEFSIRQKVSGYNYYQYEIMIPDDVDESDIKEYILSHIGDDAKLMYEEPDILSEGEMELTNYNLEDE